MVFEAKRITLRGLLVVSVACGLALAGCSKGNSGSAKIDPRTLQAPAANPVMVDGRLVTPEGARAPEGNMGLGAGSQYQHQPTQIQRDKPEQARGTFDWLWKDTADSVNESAGAGNQHAAYEAPVAAAGGERKRPTLNSQGVENSDAILAPASYDAVQTGHVEVQEVAVSSASTFAPVEQASPSTVQTSNTYPSLSSVPPRPERLNAAEARDGKFAALEQEYETTVAARQQLDTQVAHDARVAGGNTTSLAQDGYAGIQSYGDEVQIIEERIAQPIAGATEEQPWQSAAARRAGNAPHVIDNGAQTSAETASYEPVAPVQQAAVQQAPAHAEPAPVVLGSAPAPLVAPQAALAPVHEGEWVDLTSDAPQGAVPVDNVAVSAVPHMDNVALSPEAVQLVAPYALNDRNARALPESRYTSRRQAIYSQQYARRAAVDRVN